MFRINKRKQSIIIVLAVLFLLGRIVGLHAHGHMDMGDNHHNHDESFSFSQHLNHNDDVIHVANNIIDSHDLVGSHDEHGTKVIDIDNDAIVKNQNQLSDSQVIFLLFVILFVGAHVFLVKSIRPKIQFTLPFKPVCFKNHPLRAPPFLA